MITFLRRITGSHEADRQVDRKFRERLNGVDQKNAELDRLGEELDDVLAAVSARQSQISCNSIPPRVSSRNHVDSGQGDPGGPRESDPPAR